MGHGPGLAYKRGMNTLLSALLAVGLAGLVVVLLTGVISMARGGEFNRKYSNRLMRLRVLLQFAVVIILLLLLVSNA